MNWLLSILYGLLVIWTGLMRGIEAQDYKPNSLWFCLAMGLICIAGAYCYRRKWNRTAATLCLFATAVILLFYFYCFISQPEKDATVRVGIIIVASIGYAAMILLPPEPPAP